MYKNYSFLLLFSSSLVRAASSVGGEAPRLHRGGRGARKFSELSQGRRCDWRRVMPKRFFSQKNTFGRAPREPVQYINGKGG